MHQAEHINQVLKWRHPLFVCSNALRYQPACTLHVDSLLSTVAFPSVPSNTPHLRLEFIRPWAPSAFPSLCLSHRSHRRGLRFAKPWRPLLSVPEWAWPSPSLSNRLHARRGEAGRRAAKRPPSGPHSPSSRPCRRRSSWNRGAAPSSPPLWTTAAASWASECGIGSVPPRSARTTSPIHMVTIRVSYISPFFLFQFLCPQQSIYHFFLISDLYKLIKLDLDNH